MPFLEDFSYYIKVNTISIHNIIGLTSLQNTTLAIEKWRIGLYIKECH